MASLDKPNSSATMDVGQDSAVAIGAAGTAASTGPSDSSAPLSVLHVIPDLGLGGAERVVLMLMRLLADRGVRCRLCVIGAANAFPSRLDGLEPPIFLNRPVAIGRLLQTRHTARRLRAVVRRIQPDIVHTHLWPADIIGAMAIRGLGVAHVSHQHGTNPWVHERGWRKDVRRWLTRRLLIATNARLIAVSHAVAEHIASGLDLPRDRFDVVYNVVDAEEFAGVHPPTAERHRSLVIGAAGRFAPEKRIEMLIEAVAVLKRRGVACELRLAGGGSQQPACERLASSLGLGDGVRFCGVVEDMRPFYAGLDAFVLPSASSEGLSIAMLEAMACSLPVVATDVGGAREAIDHGTGGLIVPAGDVAALADALEMLARQPARRRNMGRAAREKIRRCYSATSLGPRVGQVYQRCLRGIGSGSGAANRMMEQG